MIKKRIKSHMAYIFVLNGPIEKIPMQANLYSHTGWSGVRISVRFPVFYLGVKLTILAISHENDDLPPDAQPTLFTRRGPQHRNKHLCPRQWFFTMGLHYGKILHSGWL